MKRVEKVNVVRRLGRPPKAGEHYSGPGSPCIYIRGPGAEDSSFQMPYSEAVEITQEKREYEVEDPVVPWIRRYFQYSSDWDVGVRMRCMSDAYRAEVAKRAKEAAERIKFWQTQQVGRVEAERIILDAFGVQP